MLLLVFILSFYTGVELHIAGQGGDHESWHIWAIFHTNASLLFMILGIIHVKSHWAWYKGLRTVGCKGKRKAVLLLSIVFLLAVVSGILLVCFVDGANSSLGLWHYRIGVFVSVLGVLHILKRKRGLYKGVRRHVYCWLQFILSASCFWVIFICSILSSICIAIFWENLLHS